MQIALDELWGHALGLFEEEPGVILAIEAGLMPQAGGLRQRWEAEVSGTLAQAGLRIPEIVSPPAASRRQHADHLPRLVEELQSVARSDPMAVW